MSLRDRVIAAGKKRAELFRRIRRYQRRGVRPRRLIVAFHRWRTRHIRLREEYEATKRRSVSDRLWGGSRQVTNEVIWIVGSRAPITSRKRTQTYGNPGSDHHVSQTKADAVDFGIANAHSLKNEISRKLGGPSQLPDYGQFVISRGGRSYRVQIIAGTHGTGPHLHVGVRRVG